MSERRDTAIFRAAQWVNSFMSTHVIACCPGGEGHSSDCPTVTFDCGDAADLLGLARSLARPTTNPNGAAPFGVVVIAEHERRLAYRLWFAVEADLYEFLDHVGEV